MCPHHRPPSLSVAAYLPPDATRQWRVVVSQPCATEPASSGEGRPSHVGTANPITATSGAAAAAAATSGGKAVISELPVVLRPRRVSIYRRRRPTQDSPPAGGSMMVGLTDLMESDRSTRRSNRAWVADDGDEIASVATDPDSTGRGVGCSARCMVSHGLDRYQSC